MKNQINLKDIICKHDIEFIKNYASNINNAFEELDQSSNSDIFKDLENTCDEFIFAVSNIYKNRDILGIEITTEYTTNILSAIILNTIKSRYNSILKNDTKKSVQHIYCSVYTMFTMMDHCATEDGIDKYIEEHITFIDPLVYFIFIIILYSGDTPATRLYIMDKILLYYTDEEIIAMLGKLIGFGAIAKNENIYEITDAGFRFYNRHMIIKNIKLE